MKVRVQDIDPSKGKSLSFKGTEDFLKEILARLTADDPREIEGLPQVPEIRAELELERDGKTVHVSGDAHALIHPPCARCLRAVATSLDPHIDLHLLPAIAEEDGHEVELDEDELDENTYTNDEIDVGLLLNEQILLERPFKILCSEDCKGLCAICGVNKNDTVCGCKDAPKHPGLAALAEIKLKD